MGRRRPKSFAHWAIGVVCTVITALIIYQLRIHKAEYRLERDLTRIEQHLQRNLASHLPVAHQPSPGEVVARQEATHRQAEIDRRVAVELAKTAVQERRKEDAWSEYFTPTQRCQIPESQRMVEICQASEAKFRARFEADWVADKRT